MSRTVGSYGPKTMEAIRQAGLRLIHRHGYEAMTLRQLAAEVGLQVGSLYNHINNKQDFLFDLVTSHMETLLAALDQAVGDKGDASALLRDFIAFHVTYHIHRKLEVFICFSELRSLEPENYRAVVAMRRAYERRLEDILQRGVAERTFAIADTRVASFCILAMLTGVCTWFTPGGRLSVEQVVAISTSMVMDGVAARPGAQAALSRPEGLQIA